jgi:hypothetical protein
MATVILSPRGVPTWIRSLDIMMAEKKKPAKTPYCIAGVMGIVGYGPDMPTPTGFFFLFLLYSTLGPLFLFTTSA